MKLRTDQANDLGIRSPVGLKDTGTDDKTVLHGDSLLGNEPDVKTDLVTPYRKCAYAVSACGRGLSSNMLKSGAGRLLAGRMYEKRGKKRTMFDIRPTKENIVRRKIEVKTPAKNFFACSPGRGGGRQNSDLFKTAILSERFVAGGAVDRGLVDDFPKR